MSGGPATHAVDLVDQHATTSRPTACTRCGWPATCSRDGFVVLNGDVLFHDQLLWDLLTSRDEDALLMAARRGERLLGRGDEDPRPRRAASPTSPRRSTPAETDGENVGIAKFGATARRVLVDELDRPSLATAARATGCRAPSATFARRRPLHVVETRGFPWTEIDFPEDYWRACADVLPAIAAIDHTAVAPPDGRTRRRTERAGRLAHHV